MDVSRLGNHRLACPRRKMAGLGKLLHLKWIERLEHDQKLASCCRHPENHDVEAWFSCAFEEQRGTPDIYRFVCTCGKKHVFFCVGAGERPVWR